MSDTDPQFEDLEHKVDDLIALCAELSRENVELKAATQSWQLERQQLVDKNELARTRVQAMISRLKAMEQDQ
jgi:cell division protein ZapB